MVNFHDPAVIAQDVLIISKLWHTLSGLYLWEFVTTLDYEWDVIRRRRPYLWTIWIYSLTRVAALMTVILSFLDADDTTKFNCKVETVFQFIFGYLTFAAASFLIVLRIIAIWNKTKSIIVIATVVWGTNVAFLVQNVVQIRATWSPADATCIVDNIRSTKLNIITIFVTDVILLLIMLIGLINLGFHQRDAYGVGRLLWRQGLIWLLIATAAEVLPLVFICLDLNDPFDYMFQIPSLIIMSIAATRIYRQLTDFTPASSDFVITTDSVRTSDHTASMSGRDAVTTIPLKHAVHKTCEQYRAMPNWGQNASLVTVEGQLHDNAVGLVGFDDDPESGMNSQTETP